MTVETRFVEIQSRKEGDMINLTDKICEIISDSKISDGIANIFVKGSTGSIITMEYEPGLIRDFPDMLSRIIPKDIISGHEAMWHDGNGHSHVKASLVGPSLTVPFNNNTLHLGTWQQIVFVEFDTRGRNRNIILQIIGE